MLIGVVWLNGLFGLGRLLFSWFCVYLMLVNSGVLLLLLLVVLSLLKLFESVLMVMFVLV